MNELGQIRASKLEVEGHGSTTDKRTLTDTLLIAAWVAIYAGVLLAFRVAKVVENTLSSK